MLKQQKDRIQALLEDNHRLLSMISTLKLSSDFEGLSKSVRMFSYETQDLNIILKAGKIGINKKGVGFSNKCQQGVITGCSKIVFVCAKKDEDEKQVEVVF